MKIIIVSLKFRQFALFAIPLRVAIAQASVGVLLLSAIVLIFVARGHADTFSAIRMSLANAIRPVLVAAHEPVEWSQNFLGQLQTAAVLQLENRALREEVVNLREWHAEAVRLNAENRALRSLLQMKQPHEIESAAGTVLADNGTSFGHSVIVTVPREFRLRRGQVAMTGSGMVGRVVDAATDSGMARVLLLDDPASRLPVMISNSRARAILSGQGNGELLLEHLPGNAQVQMGDKIVTAGSDGVLPSDLALARITRIDGDRVYAEPLAALDRLEWLRIVDFGTISTLSKPNFQTP
ncbi:MAG TPA: rod shape-determining protein MreC [Alphaproteobacteria bacterium]|nr:rod shape-determining protein MreC [Rhodospirillaceae bacterium]HRJ11668.1 rod shape-determining protein MreC [Alphaproteobacteria bacterium]